MAAPSASEAGRSLLSRESLLTLLALCLLIVERHYRDFGLLADQHWIFEWHLSTVVALFIIPVIVLILMRAAPGDFGLRWGVARVWGPYLALYFAVTAPVLILASGHHSMREYYPQYRLVLSEPGLWPILILSYGCYFLAWEFFFRGFLLFALARRFGAYAIVLQTVPFCLMHLGKPHPEVWASVVAGLALGLMAYRGKSFLPCAFLHWLCAVGFELLAVSWGTAP
ncbi:MAG: CPBP family intramembrane metalloprotease [Armatimonadota bacterium]|jgi:membrane protease YdiL (CAAX protease family)